MRKQNRLATSILTDDIHRINEKISLCLLREPWFGYWYKKRKPIWLQWTMADWGTTCAWKKKKKVHCSEFDPLISYFTSFFIFKSDDLWKNRVIQKVHDLFITTEFSKLLKLYFETLFKKLNKSTYGLTHMAVILHNLVFFIM